MRTQDRRREGTTEDREEDYPNLMVKEYTELLKTIKRHIVFALTERYPQYLHVELSEIVVQNPTGQTAEAQVGAEASRTGIQRACVDPRVLKVGHPHLHGETVRTLK